jgi:metallothiol transferase
MKLVHSGRSDAYLEWGSAWICLLEKKEHTYQSNVLGMDHIAFTVDESEFNELVAKIRDQNIPIVRQPVWRGGGFSFQCKDPDGIVLEFFTGSLKRRMKNWK